MQLQRFYEATNRFYLNKLMQETKTAVGAPAPEPRKGSFKRKDYAGHVWNPASSHPNKTVTPESGRRSAGQQAAWHKMNREEAVDETRKPKEKLPGHPCKFCREGSAHTDAQHSSSTKENQMGSNGLLGSMLRRR